MSNALTAIGGKFRSLFGEQDMTVGKTSSCLWKFAIPMLISNIIQQLYSAADAAIVGNYIGSDALSAVTATGPIVNFFLVFLMAVGAGVTVMVSQYFGAKDNENLGLSVGNAITLMIIMSVVLTAISVPLTSPLLKLLETNEDILGMTHIYLLILFWGTAASGFYNVMSGILRGLGDSVFPLIALLIAVVINIFLDIWLVSSWSAKWGAEAGVAGAAVATVASQLISAIACTVRILHRKQLFSINRATLKLKSVIVRQIVRLGLPTGIQMAVMFLSNIVMQPFIMAMGSSVFAAQGATMRVDGFAVMPCMAFQNAVSTYTGQNIGAGKMDRVKKGGRTTLIMSMAFTLVMVAAILIWGKYLFALFLKVMVEVDGVKVLDKFGKPIVDQVATDALVKMGMGFITIMVPAYIIMAVNMTFNGVMRGAGDSVGTMWISLIINVFLKVPVTLILIFASKTAADGAWPNGNPDMMMWGMVICMCIGVVITLVYYKIGRWKKKSIIRQAVAN
ncbi:MAG: MATE family efflux transporter [Oscillospiraceae bacterium]|jgi:putative MATE family efflux protein|nr:MATE family efflux transporter [Oscillospiraceae bacterium]